MKLRVRHNSIRLRLGKSEVDRLGQGIACMETLYFPGDQTLAYIIEPSSAGATSVLLSGHTIRVQVPQKELADWSCGGRVGIAADIAVPGQDSLQVRIEKDFRCLDSGREEDQSDAFDNPLDTHESINCETKS